MPFVAGFRTGSEVPSAFADLLDLARRMLDASTTFVCRVSPAPSVLMLRGEPVALEHLDGLCTRVQANGALVVMPPEEEDAGEGLFLAGVPLRTGNGTLEAVLGVSDASRRALSEADREILQQVGRLAEDRLCAEAVLHETEGRWQRLVEQNPAPIIITMEGEILYINPAGAELLGSPNPEALIGTSLYDTVSGRQATVMAERATRIQRGDMLPSQMYDIIRLDGAQRRIEAFSVPVIYGGGRAVQTVWRDVTEQHAHEQELVRAKERAEEMDRLKTTFLMNMSHEIRTPMTAILGFSEVLGEEGDAAERELAQYIQDSGERLMVTLNTLLDLAQIEGRAVTLTPERIDVVEQVLRVLYLFKRKAQKVGLALRLAVPTGRAVYARLDPTAFQRVVSNLLSNGIKFTHEGSVTVDVEADGAALVLHVEDTGIGISMGFLERSFEAFEQESQGMARSYEGSGIGLTVTKRLVELMGGTIEVHSEKGKGSRFTVRFEDVIVDPGSSSS